MKIEFHKKIEQFTKERMELFTKEYYDEKKGVFIPQDKFKYKYEEVYFDDCPLFIPFYVLCNISSKLEEYKSEKGFFESLFLERGDAQVKFQEVPEFSKTIPEYFNNGDYVLVLPCLHIYHTKCIKEWFNSNNTCPLCRMELSNKLFENKNGVNCNNENSNQNINTLNNVLNNSVFEDKY